MSRVFSNGKTGVHVKTVGEAVAELRRLPPETPLDQGDPGDGADLVLFNEAMATEHVMFVAPHVWVD